MYNLYLDDYRIPRDSYVYTHNALYVLRPWQIARSYEEFVSFINTQGLPDLISFDHDLADEHYREHTSILDYEKDSSNYKEKTGFECAKWLVNYCIDNNKKLPEFLCHSMNPIGKENILSLLNQFKKSQE